MRAFTGFVFALAAGLLLCVTPASAHRLRLFATVEDGALTGYAFFVGSSRAHGADVIFKDEAGTILHRMQTDSEGSFLWRPGAPHTFRISASTRDGHVSEATVDISRFGAVAQVETPSAASERQGAGVAAGDAGQPTRDELARLIESKVDAAVERQLRPLLEAYDASETRLRFNDVMGGIGMIVGLAGMALWATGRRNRRKPAPGESDSGDAT